MQANLIAVGAVHALESGFGKGQPKALRKFTQSLERAVQKITRTHADDGRNRDASSLFEAFGGSTQSVRRGPRVGRKDRP